MLKSLLRDPGPQDEPLRVGVRYEGLGWGSGVGGVGWLGEGWESGGVGWVRGGGWESHFPLSLRPGFLQDYGPWSSPMCGGIQCWNF
jgi:hypothetical protein